MDFMHNRPWDLLHLWSLAVEEQFYLLWPAALVLFWNQKEKIAIGAILAAPLFRVVFRFGGMHGIMQYAFPCVEDALAAGCLLAMYRDRIPTRRVDRWIVPIVILVLAVNQFQFPFGVYPMLLQTSRNLCIALVVDHCIRKEYRVLNWAPVVWLGWISYSLYLWQMPFLSPAGMVNPRHMWFDFPYNLGFALVAGCASYYLVEQPVLRLRDRVFRKPYAAAKVVAAAN
jgi:peptidoglycan/LPS O-acetylase OafA/YrhL